MTEKIALVVRELTYLKALHPIMVELKKAGQQYIIYHYDMFRGAKEYNRATRKKMVQSSREVMAGAKKIKAFADEKELQKGLLHDRITKMVSLEIWLWARKYMDFFKKHNIKTYSIMYLTDSLWQPDPRCATSVYRVYYSSRHIMEKHHKFAGIKYNEVRDKCIGSPIFDSLAEETEGEDILVLLPNMLAEHVRATFGTKANFNKIIEKVCEYKKPIFKARKKQWIPKIVKNGKHEIIFDGAQMYPPKISELLQRSFAVVMFLSSGVYECVYSGNYVINITIPVKRWSWSKDKMQEYFSTKPQSLYNFEGVIESHSQEGFLSGDFNPRRIDKDKQKDWVKSFGVASGASNIAQDIINS